MGTARADSERPIGRDRQIGLLEARLGAGSFVTITGLGGTGKTTVAIELAHRAADLGNRSFVVDLAAIADPSAVPSVIASALGARAIGGTDILAGIGIELARVPTLLVLDNFEQVLAAGTVAQTIRASAPSTSILVTSRVALGLEGEYEFRLEPLVTPASPIDLESAPASVLFLARARMPAAELTVDDRAAVAAICRSLDGLPLALELAAAWTSILSPRAIERRLEAARLPLSDAQRTRQSSVDTIVEATLALVDPEDRVVFERLGAIVGWFDEAAARAVTGADDVLERLRALNAVALLQVSSQRDGEPTFRMLETVRALAARNLEATADSESIRRSHAEHFADAAERAAVDFRHRSFGDAVALSRLNDPNLLVAYEFACKAGLSETRLRLATYESSAAVHSGNIAASVDRIERALAGAVVPPALRADALNALVSLRSARGAAGQVRLAESAVSAAREANDPWRIARTLVTLGNELDDRQAIDVLGEAIVVAESAGYQWATAVAALNLGNRHLTLGRLVGAVEALRLAGERFTAIGDHAGVGGALSTLGDVHAMEGDDEAALLAYEEALTLLRGASSPVQMLTATSCGLALLLERRGDHDGAVMSVNEALDALGDSESKWAWVDIATPAVIVLAETHPKLAARLAGTLVEDDVALPARQPFREAVEAVIRALGAVQAHRAMRAGRRADRATLRSELAGALDSAGTRRSRRLRAAYETFTPREVEVMDRLAAGRRDGEIAEDLGMSPKTASVHVGNIKAKLGVSNRVEAALIGRRLLDAAARQARTLERG